MFRARVSNPVRRKSETLRTTKARHATACPFLVVCLKIKQFSIVSSRQDVGHWKIVRSRRCCGAGIGSACYYAEVSRFVLSKSTVHGF